MGRYAAGEHVALEDQPDQELEVVKVIERPGRRFEYELRLPNRKLIRADEGQIVPAQSEAGFG